MEKAYHQWSVLALLTTESTRRFVSSDVMHLLVSVLAKMIYLIPLNL